MRTALSAWVVLNCLNVVRLAASNQKIIAKDTHAKREVTGLNWQAGKTMHRAFGLFADVKRPLRCSLAKN